MHTVEIVHRQGRLPGQRKTTMHQARPAIHIRIIMFIPPPIVPPPRRMSLTPFEVPLTPRHTSPSYVLQLLVSLPILDHVIRNKPSKLMRKLQICYHMIMHTHNRIINFNSVYRRQFRTHHRRQQRISSIHIPVSPSDRHYPHTTSNVSRHHRTRYTHVRKSLLDQTMSRRGEYAAPAQIVLARRRRSTRRGSELRIQSRHRLTSAPPPISSLTMAVAPLFHLPCPLVTHRLVSPSPLPPRWSTYTSMYSARLVATSHPCRRQHRPGH